MLIQHIFAIGVGKVTVKEQLSLAKKVFAENDNILFNSKESNNFRTTLNGYVSQRANLITYANTQNVDGLKQTIKKHALDFLNTCGYDTSKITLEVANFWLNEMKNQSHHSRHDHYGFNLSGCYYVDVPKDSGKIYFHNINVIDSCGGLSVKNYTPLNSSNWNFIPEEGDMFFWKSTLQHEVPSTEFNGVRRSIAFDILINGT